MAQCDYNKEVIDKILTIVGDIAERVGKMDGKVDALEQGTRLGMQFCDLCQGTGYYTKSPSPGQPAEQYPCHVCDRRGWKVTRKEIDADKLDEEFPQQ